jgi:type IV pilus assembly protein PilA
MKISHHLHARTGQGFTLIELMLTIAIFGILAAVAIPAYQNHLKKEKFAEVIAASATAKSAVEACMQHLNAAAGCDGGSNGIPADLTANAGNRVAAVSTKNGVVTVVPRHSCLRHLRADTDSRQSDPVVQRRQRLSRDGIVQMTEPAFRYACQNFYPI